MDWSSFSSILHTLHNKSLSCSIFVGSGFSLEKIPSFDAAAKKLLKEFSISQSTKQSEILFVFGEINQKTAPILRFHYEQLNEPAFVVHVYQKFANDNFSYAEVEQLNEAIPIHLEINCLYLNENSVKAILELIDLKLRNKSERIDLKAFEHHITERPFTKTNLASRKKQQNEEGERSSAFVAEEKSKDLLEENSGGHLYKLTRRRLGIQPFLRYKQEYFNEWAEIKSMHLMSLCRFYKHDKDTLQNVLVDMTAIQNKSDHSIIEVIYFFRSTIMPYKIQLSVTIQLKEANLPSISSVYPAARWLERELYDMFGITFEGHPNLKRILLYPGFMGNPLQKGYPKGRVQPLIPIKKQDALTQNICIDKEI